MKNFSRILQLLVFGPAYITNYVVVYSINGDCKTNSDSREIFLKPMFTPVQYVNIISLPDSSALISWEPPKQSVNKPLQSYTFYHFTSSEPDTDLPDRIVLGKYITPSLFSINHQHEQIRVFNLKPGITYTYVIVPLNEEGYGFQYQTQQKFEVCDQDLPIAKPDFSYKFEKYGLNNVCLFSFRWLPCGQSFNCENTKPGSDYTFNFEPEALGVDYKREYGYNDGVFERGQMYNVTVVSSIGNNFSESVTKIFKDCNELRENIP